MVFCMINEFERPSIADFLLYVRVWTVDVCVIRLFPAIHATFETTFVC